MKSKNESNSFKSDTGWKRAEFSLSSKSSLRFFFFVTTGWSRVETEVETIEADAKKQMLTTLCQRIEGKTFR